MTWNDATNELDPFDADPPLVLDPEMHRIRELLLSVTPTGLPILILGETGSGKEVAAEWVHRCSGAPAQRFLRINCAGIAETLIDSELFGHEKGAFTGAQCARRGVFEEADGGTLLLDEIGELSLVAQAKLLRVLERGEIVRVGACRPRRVQVRVVAATHRDLEAMVAAGTFRQDLYYRLNAITIRIPPLRERAAEIVPLAELFLARLARRMRRSPPALSERARASLVDHHWPGNIRELRHVIERAAVLAKGGAIAPEDLGLAAPPRDAREDAPIGASTSARDIREQVRRFERDRIVATLERTGGNQTRAAELLGVSRRTLTNKLSAYEIDRPRRKARASRDEADDDALGCAVGFHVGAMTRPGRLQ